MFRLCFLVALRSQFVILKPAKLNSRRRFSLHFPQRLRNQRRDVMSGALAVGVCLIEHEVGQGQARQRRLQVVTGVDANRAVEDVDAVMAQAATQGQESCRGVAEDTGLAAIALVEIHVASPE